MAHIARTTGPVIYCLGGRGGSLGRSHGFQGEQRADQLSSTEDKGWDCQQGGLHKNITES